MGIFTNWGKKKIDRVENVGFTTNNGFGGSRNIVKEDIVKEFDRFKLADRILIERILEQQEIQSKLDKENRNFVSHFATYDRELFNHVYKFNMVSLWFDRRGNPLNDYGKIEELLSDPDYKILAKTKLPSGSIVSTVWLGLTHGTVSLTTQAAKAHLIFETMVFKEDSHEDVYCQRYPTEEAAFKGHLEVVKEFTKKITRNENY